MIQNLHLAFKLFKREFQNGGLTLLFLSLVIATGSLSSVGFLIKRIDASMSSHADQLNGAQLILKSSRAVPESWLDQADKLKLAQAQMLVFPSMLVVNDEFKLAQIKAVSDNFPLQGELRVKKTNASESTISKHAPPRGEIWLDKRLLLFFNLPSDAKNAASASVELGESQFHATGLLERVPGQSNSFFTIAPAAMINLSDLAQTATIQPGSRIDYIYFFSASDASPSSLALQTFQQWLKPKLQAGQSLRSGVEDLKVVNTSLKKAGDFLSLAAILTVLLSAIAITINSHRYAQQQYKNSAIMLCLGCSENRIRLIEFYKLIALGSAGSFVGIVLGYFIYLGILSAFGDALSIDINDNWAGFYAMPAWVALCCGLFLLLSLSMAYLGRLKNISPLGLIRKDFLYKAGSRINFNSWILYFFSFVGLLLLSIWYTGNIKITLLFYSALSLGSVVLYFASQIILKYTLNIARKYQWINRLSLLNLERHKREVLLQITTFSLIFALLIIIFLVRTELLDNWQQQFPEQTPNHFVINIQSYERLTFEQFLVQHKIKTEGLYPMVRGRLTELNKQPIIQAVPETAKEHNALHRELNLSYEHDKAAENNGEKAEISIEHSMAKALNIKPGDRLGFRVGSRKIEGVVTQIRKVKWDSFQPNFYIIFSPGLIEQYPVTWISSFYLAPEDKVKLNLLMKQFPGITIIEVDEILKEVQFIIERVSDAIELIFLFIILAGVLILSSSLSSTLASRMYENAVIRTLGASARQLRHYLFIEFVVVALLSAFIAVLLAESGIALLYQQVFQMPYALHPGVWLGISVISLILICSLGMLVVNKIFTQPAHILLNQFTE